MDADITRRVALYQLLDMPDPPGMHRGNVVRLEGKPDRHDILPILAAAYARSRLLEVRQRDLLKH